MRRKSTSTKGPRQRYSPECKGEALALAAQVGVSEAPAQLKLATSLLYAWRAEAEASRERLEVDGTWTIVRQRNHRNKLVDPVMQCVGNVLSIPR
jgi:transposase-like protein